MRTQWHYIWLDIGRACGSVCYNEEGRFIRSRTAPYFRAFMPPTLAAFKRLATERGWQYVISTGDAR